MSIFRVRCVCLFVHRFWVFWVRIFFLANDENDCHSFHFIFVVVVVVDINDCHIENEWRFFGWHFLKKFMIWNSITASEKFYFPPREKKTLFICPAALTVGYKKNDSVDDDGRVKVRKVCHFEICWNLLKNKKFKKKNSFRLMWYSWKWKWEKIWLTHTDCSEINIKWLSTTEWYFICTINTTFYSLCLVVFFLNFWLWKDWRVG